MDLSKLTSEQKRLRLRILEITHEIKTAHIGSCLSVIDIVDTVYQIKKDNEKFILSNGHAGVALYTVLEKKGLLDNPSLKTLHVHPDRNSEIGIDVSTGSLGQGLPIAVGMALADRKKRIFCIISDGEAAEGSIWESLRIASDQKLNNLHILVNANGWGAYGPLSPNKLLKRLKGFVPNVIVVDGHNPLEIKQELLKPSKNVKVIMAKTTSEQLPFLKGLDAHYYVMTEEDFNLGKKLLQ